MDNTSFFFIGKDHCQQNVNIEGRPWPSIFYHDKHSTLFSQNGYLCKYVLKLSRSFYFLTFAYISKYQYFHSNFQEQVKICNQKLCSPFSVGINCSSDLKTFANSWSSALNFERFSQSLEQFFLTVFFGKKIPNIEPRIVIREKKCLWILSL